MTELKFELRKRTKQQHEFWSILYDKHSGRIKSIEPGQTANSTAIVVNYSRVKKILSGEANQNDYKIALNENIGALDLVDTRRPTDYKKKVVFQSWLTAGETEVYESTPLRAILYVDTGHIRFEASRIWTTRIKEGRDRDIIDDSIPFFISDAEDPHILFGQSNIQLQEIIERGFWETRTWAFMNHGLVQKILYHGQKVRINMPPVANGLSFIRSPTHSPFTEVIDEKTIISHVGQGKHISVFAKDGGLWAQSHYYAGSPIDNLQGNLTVAVLNGPDPEYFHSWAHMPALMLRQHHPFELVSNWPSHVTPSLLYKANNLDIGVLQ